MIPMARNGFEWLTRAKLFYPILAVFEIALCFIIIKKVAYTEIDWVAYMQEVKGYIDGEKNYLNLYGDTGPLVYPAGFVYIFSLLYWITSQGGDILTGQYIFAALSVLNLITVLALYRSGSSDSIKIHPSIAILLLVSKRIHSIFVLRMFNDCIAVMCGYMAVLLFTKNKWRSGCFIYSFGVSVKMNMLLYAPGVLLVLLIGTGFRETLICLNICAGLQLILGYPFLSTYPIEYLTRAFDVKRVFMYKWTVNLRFLSEDIFVGKTLSLVLLVSTLGGMILFGYKWINENLAALPQKEKERSWKFFALIDAVRHDEPSTKPKLSNHFIITTIFASNFIGITFARTLHYQFYVWYFHTIPYLLWHAKALPVAVKLFVFVSIEIAFNVYPATAWSSSLLQVAHLVLLLGLFCSPAPLVTSDAQTKMAASKEF